jgi:hypothetical protein
MSQKAGVNEALYRKQVRAYKTVFYRIDMRMI